jgi:DNA-binding transcriptional ArsR family regulator
MGGCGSRQGALGSHASDVGRRAAEAGEAGELCVCDLSWIAGRSQNLVSHHMRALRDRGLVSCRRDGKLVIYSLTPAGRSLLGAVAGEPVGEPA